MSKERETYTCVIHKGKVGGTTRKDIKTKLLSLEGILTDITIGAAKKNRSSPQNRYWWGVVVKHVRTRFKELGHTLDEDEVHEYLKSRCKVTAGKVVDEETGLVIDYVKSTTKLSTSEFMELVADTQQWSAEILNISIPDPTEIL